VLHCAMDATPSRMRIGPVLRHRWQPTRQDELTISGKVNIELIINGALITIRNAIRANRWPGPTYYFLN